jgi:hypothetical protein
MSSSAQPVSIGPRTLRSAGLTRTQELIWASQRLHPEVPLANMGKRTRISGPLDPDRLVQAFDAVVRASEALRMVVDASARAGDERVRVLDRPPRSTEVVDLPVTDLDAWSRDRIAQPIDAAECVYDSVVLRHADDDWTWWLDLHHVATDATGSALVYAATAAAYEQLAAGDVVDLTGVVVGEFFDVAESLAREPGGRDTPAERAAEWRADREAAGPQPPIELYGPVGPRTTLVDRVPVVFDDEQRRRLDEAISGPYRSISRELGLLGLGRDGSRDRGPPTRRPLHRGRRRPGPSSIVEADPTCRRPADGAVSADGQPSTRRRARSTCSPACSARSPRCCAEPSRARAPTRRSRSSSTCSPPGTATSPACPRRRSGCGPATSTRRTNCGSRCTTTTAPTGRRRCSGSSTSTGR